MSNINDTEKDRPRFTCHMPDEILAQEDIRPFLEEIHTIDVSVYSPEDAGEVEPMVERYSANPQSYIYVRDDKGLLVGYLNFFPVKKELQDLILSPDTPYALLDDAISADQVSAYEKDKEHFIFVLSIAILPPFREREVIRMLTDGMISFLRKMHTGC